MNNPKSQVVSAISELKQMNGIRVLAISSLYKSKPVGPQDQPDFINAVIKVDTNLDARSLLSVLQVLEQQHGRVKTIHWGPRTLDLDILLFGNEIIHEDNLVVPHPELANRNFVLYPLQEIAAEVYIPGIGSIVELIKLSNRDGLVMVENI